jgi:bifunctional enzyme CysN/CysC
VGLESPDQAPAAARVTPRERARRLGHQPATVWLTGGTQEDRTAVAYALEKRLFEAGVCCCVLQEPSSKAADAAMVLNEAGLVAICDAHCDPRDLDAAARRIGQAQFFRSAISPGEPVAACVDRIVQSLRTGGMIP